MRYVVLFVAAVVLGYVSPWIASPDDGPILFLWFNWLPTLAAEFFVLDGWAALALDVMVLTRSTSRCSLLLGS